MLSTGQSDSVSTTLLLAASQCAYVCRLPGPLMLPPQQHDSHQFIPPHTCVAACCVLPKLPHQRNLMNPGVAHLFIEKHHVDATACSTSISHRQLQHWPHDALLDCQVIYVDAASCGGTGAAQQNATHSSERLICSSTMPIMHTEVLAQCIAPVCSSASSCSSSSRRRRYNMHKGLHCFAQTQSHLCGLLIPCQSLCVAPLYCPWYMNMRNMLLALSALSCT
jgi:hypothetical protein